MNYNILIERESRVKDFKYNCNIHCIINIRCIVTHHNNPYIDYSFINAVMHISNLLLNKWLHLIEDT